MTDRRECRNAAWRKLTLCLCIAGLVLALAAAGDSPALSSAAPAGPAQTFVDPASVASDNELVRRSDLIVHGVLQDEEKAYPTGRNEGTHKIVHYVQRVRVTEVWKGNAPTGRSISLLTSGLEPQADSSNPLNKSYTGPLVGGEYVFFLRRAEGSDYYTLTGLWQGLYPVYEGKSTALLHNGGFPAFDRLTIAALKNKIQHAASAAN